MGLFTVGDFDSSKDFYGKITDNEIELRKRKSWLWRNDFSPHLFAKLIPSSRGTRIEGHFGHASRVRAVQILWISLAVVSGGIVFIGTVIQLATGQRHVQDDGVTWGLLFPLALITAGFLMPKLFYYTSVWHERDLIAPYKADAIGYRHRAKFFHYRLKEHLSQRHRWEGANGDSLSSQIPSHSPPSPDPSYIMTPSRSWAI